MKFSKDLLNFGFLHVYKILASKVFFLGFLLTKTIETLSSKWLRVYTSFTYQIRADNEGMLLFGVLTFDDIWSRPKVLNFCCLIPYNHLESS